MVSRCLGEDAFLGSHVAGNYAQLRFSSCEGILLPPHPQARTPVSGKRFARSCATSLTLVANALVEITSLGLASHTLFSAYPHQSSGSAGLPKGRRMLGFTGREDFCVLSNRMPP